VRPFQPPNCPNSRCKFHQVPESGQRWFASHGNYKPNCRASPVPRFRCLGCRRCFSRQSFRMDNYDHRPDVNAKLFELLTLGVSLRQCARRLGMSRRCIELKARKIAVHLSRVQPLLRAEFPATSRSRVPLPKARGAALALRSTKVRTPTRAARTAVAGRR
jgi:transposase-like protein